MSEADWLRWEPLVRLVCFVGVLLGVALAEALAPRRRLRVGRRRWAANLGLAAINTLLLRLLFPAAGVGVALWAEQHGPGLLAGATLPRGLQVVGAVVVLDLAVYLQHRLFHVVPILWRLHRIHHADLDFDWSTALRFHPLEIVLSMVYKALWIWALGLSVVGVLAFEVVLSVTALFNHGNLKLPERVDGVLRLFIVTPDQHRVHHSVVPLEMNSNYGFNLPWWDRLLGTYRATPQAGQVDMVVGVPDLSCPADCLSLWGQLVWPFRRQ